MDACYFLTLLLSTHVQIEVNEGILKGQVVKNEYGCPYFSFKGIPYAEPPVGELRFKVFERRPPQPRDDETSLIFLIETQVFYSKASQTKVHVSLQ
ncbi:unnamed protein product [Euphydryas editha]|uniref:Carboxylesterase type B domain-containing protein n=1 Tax=Euphydryas editha TaxID=104508 RepID=A0AAU9TFE8_EUPED|nr:unnamed protein product [Euphydryas editha]